LIFKDFLNIQYWHNRCNFYSMQALMSYWS